MRMSRRMAIYGQGGKVIEFTYTGSYDLSGDPKGDWKIKFLTSGTLRFTKLGNAKDGIDIFCVGGGAGGGINYQGDVVYVGGGGGSGYTATYSNIGIASNTQYAVVVGGGGASATSSSASALGKAGGVSYFSSTSYKADGGAAMTVDIKGSNGGSGGGGGNAYGRAGGVGGTDGSNGQTAVYQFGGAYSAGAGQGTTTREFGQADGALYAQGGGGGNGGETTPATANSGNGGNCGGYGSSGIVIIRNHRT